MTDLNLDNADPLIDINQLLQTAVDLGYLRSLNTTGDVALTSDGCQLVETELRRPENHGVLESIMQRETFNEQANGLLGVLLKVIERGTV